jgi:hypothetical protein
MAAGLGYKEFSTGDVLTAADANGYLASQVVMVFASAAARTSAIASPQEGMISYLKDTNAVEKYDGAAWVSVGGGGGGKVLQVVQGTYSTSTNSTSTTFADTGLTLSITPSASTSKILVMVSLPCEVGGNAADAGGASQLLRNSTAVFTPTGSNFNESLYFYSGGAATYGAAMQSYSYQDSPATTSATTYKVQFKVFDAGSSRYMRICGQSAQASIIAMEIGA